MRTVHVIQRGTNKPREWRDGDHIYKYGAGCSGIADRMIIHDAPVNTDDELWLRDYALSRMAPLGLVLYKYRTTPRTEENRHPE